MSSPTTGIEIPIWSSFSETIRFDIIIISIIWFRQNQNPGPCFYDKEWAWKLIMLSLKVLAVQQYKKHFYTKRMRIDGFKICQKKFTIT